MKRWVGCVLGAAMGFGAVASVGACGSSGRQAGESDVVGVAHARPAGTFMSGILRGESPVICLQQVGDFDEAYVKSAADVEAQLNVTCAERGFTRRDAALTEKMFDEPDVPGNGAFVK